MQFGKWRIKRESNGADLAETKFEIVTLRVRDERQEEFDEWTMIQLCR